MTKEKEVKENKVETEFEKVDVNIPFFKILEEPFEGKLLESENRDDESDILLCQLLDGKKVYLGGYAILKFYNHFYNEGKIVRIEFTGKETVKGGRTVNNYDFYQQK